MTRTVLAFDDDNRPGEVEDIFRWSHDIIADTLSGGRTNKTHSQDVADRERRPVAVWQKRSTQTGGKLKVRYEKIARFTPEPYAWQESEEEGNKPDTE